MNILGEVAQELFSMFVADLRLTVSTLALVALVAVLILWLKLSPLLCGAVLIGGCIIILIEAASREARRRK